MVDHGPVVPSSAGSQVPKLQGELLGAPRLLPQMVEALTHRSTLGRMVEDCPETPGELLKLVQRRISLSPHGIGPLQGSSGEARDEGGHHLAVRWSRVDYQ